MLTDMAPTATAAGQFYGSQIQTMGIANIAPHIQKAVSIKSVVSRKWSENLFFSYDGASCVQFIMLSSRHLKAPARVTNIRNEHKKRAQRIVFVRTEIIMIVMNKNISKIWCRNQCSVIFSMRSSISFSRCCLLLFPSVLFYVALGWIFSGRKCQSPPQREIEDSRGSFL